MLSHANALTSVASACFSAEHEQGTISTVFAGILLSSLFSVKRLPFSSYCAIKIVTFLALSKMFCACADAVIVLVPAISKPVMYAVSSVLNPSPVFDANLSPKTNTLKS